MSLLSTTGERKDCAIPDTCPFNVGRQAILKQCITCGLYAEGNSYVKTRVFKDNFGK